MKILQDGSVEIRNKNTGETKVVKPQDLPNFGISYDTYTSQAQAYQQLPGAKPVLQPTPEMAQKTAEASKQATAGQELKNKALTTASELKTRGTSGISGLKNIGLLLPGTGVQGTKAKYEQLKSLLSLENIKYLKGTGQISDAEQAMLASAASALNPEMSDKDFADELDKVIATLGGKPESTKQPTMQDKLNKFLGQDKNLLTDVLAGGSIDYVNDAARAIEMRGKGGQALEQSTNENLRLAQEAIKQISRDNTPEKNKILQDYANSLLSNTQESNKDVAESFSGRNEMNPLLRGLEVGSEVASVAELPAMLKNALKLSSKGIGKTAGKEAVSTIATGGADDVVSKGVSTIEKIKQYTPGSVFGRKQAEAAAKITTNVNIPERLTKGVSSLSKADPDIAKILTKETGTLKEIKDIPTLLERMSYWGKNAYGRGGDIKGTAKAALYKEFYKQGLEIIKTEAPEVYKYRKLLSYTYDLPKALGSALWKLVLGKTLIS